MKFAPMTQQVLMEDWLDTHPLAMLWVGCGLGKTAVVLQQIAKLILDGAARGALVVAPLRVAKITWPAQCDRWDHSSWLRIVNLNTPEGVAAWADGTADIYVTHYDVLATVQRRVKGKVIAYPGHVAKFLKRKTVPADILVVDEISMAKNHSSKRINALRLHSHHFKYRWGLTGTPIPNSYLDVFAQTRLIDDGERFGRGFEAFRSRYFESDYMGFKYTLRPGAKDQIDEKLKDLALVLRSSDYLDIPDTQIIDEEVALPPAARSAYQKLEKDLLLQLERGEIVALNAASLVAKLMQITTGIVYDAERGVHEIHEAKITALAAIRKRHKGEPILVLTAYQHEQERLLRAMPDAVKFHEDRIPDWQKGKIKLFVANPGQMSHGIDGLQDGGRIVAWMTPTFSQEKTIQTNARLARTGQGEETIVYRIIAKGTVDEAVMEVLRDKEENQNGAFEALKNLQRLRS
jgi:SNF2 family DNA or RNA helicase